MGGRSVTIDGNTLDTTLQLMLTAQRVSGTEGLHPQRGCGDRTDAAEHHGRTVPACEGRRHIDRHVASRPGRGDPRAPLPVERGRRAVAGLLPRRWVRRRRPRTTHDNLCRGDLPRRRRPRVVGRLPAGAGAQGTRRRRGRVRGISVGARARRRTRRRPGAGSPSAGTARAATSPRWCHSARATTVRRRRCCSC